MAKKYSINWENDEVVSVEVDGVQYDHPDQIPDPEDRSQILRLMSKSTDEDFDKDFDQEFKEEFRQLESQAARFPSIIVAIFLTIAILTLAIAAISAVTTVRALARETNAPGRVVDLVARQDQAGQTFYYPVVEFYLPHEDRQTVQLAEGSWPPAYEQGEAVTVLYDPEHPLNARIKSASSTILMWILPGITGTVGVAFLVASLFVWWFLKPGPATAPQA
jgi:hypothetical protein